MAVVNVRGRGGYVMPGLLPMAGERLGAAAGGFLGRHAGAAVETMLGAGTYESNGIVNPERSIQPEPGSQMVHNVETVIPVYSQGSAFTSFALSNNPGLPNFPWLAPIATRFNRYRFHQLQYLWVTNSGELTTSSALGDVSIATNYDVLDRQFYSVIEMEATKNAVSGKPSVNKVHGVECASQYENYKWRIVRSTTVPTGADVHLYDHSLTTLGLDGIAAPAGTLLGRLKVLYTVEFSDPIALGIPAWYMPAAPAFRSLTSTGTGAAGAGPYFGYAVLTSAPALSAPVFGSIPLQSGNTAGFSTASQAAIDITGLTLSFYTNGVFHITQSWAFSTAPSGAGLNSSGTVVTAAANGIYNPNTGAANTYQLKAAAANTFIEVDVICVVRTATVQNPATFTMTPVSWGSTFVVTASNLNIVLMGNT